MSSGSVTSSCRNICLFLHSTCNACNLYTPNISTRSLFCLWDLDMVIVWPLILVETAHKFILGFAISLTLQGHPSNLHHIMATNVQMSIIRSSAPGPPLHIGASHLPRGKRSSCAITAFSSQPLGEVHLAFTSKILLTANAAKTSAVKTASMNR